MTNVHHPRFLQFVERLESLVNSSPGESRFLEQGRIYLGELIEADDWLPEEFTVPFPTRNVQYLLHLDPKERFSVVSVVWGPGQSSTAHNHTVWGLLGVLRGAEKTQKYAVQADGSLIEDGEAELLRPKHVDAVSHTVGDVHAVSNAFDDRTSISIHVYGGNIGRLERSRFQLDGSRKTFSSGYVNA
jgi:predicted metal-dependent enzyme (double-stranded beta helix superfamily)